MILSKPAILQEHINGNILYHSPFGYKIEDFTKNQSIDIHIGDWIYIEFVNLEEFYTFMSLQEDPNGYFTKTNSLLKIWINLSKLTMPLTIPKNTFFLTHTEEFIGSNCNSSIHPEFHQRSTLARLGLSHTKAGWGDNGFYNRWCMEFYTLKEFKLAPNTRVGQISFAYTTESITGYAQQTGAYQVNSDILELAKNWKKEDILGKQNNI